MQKSKVDRKAIDEINRIQAKYGGYRPDLILMLFAKRLDCLTKTLIGLTAILAILTAVNIWLLVRGDNQPVPVYTYKIVNTYPHDPEAFTQGLAFENGVLYEGTGLYGKSSLRRVDLETGKVRQTRQLPTQYFGEGITVFKDTIIQLTWKSGLGFIYDKNSFALSGNFSYAPEGWGITHDGESLLMSDGTSTLYFLNPENFKIMRHVEVKENSVPVTGLNELEYVKGRIYANVWPTDKIAIIDRQNGQVRGWLDLSGLLPSPNHRTSVDVLNGIAYDPTNDRLFVTGKLWPWLFEIKVTTKE